MHASCCRVLRSLAPRLMVIVASVDMVLMGSRGAAVERSLAGEGRSGGGEARGQAEAGGGMVLWVEGLGWLVACCFWRAKRARDCCCSLARVASSSSVRIDWEGQGRGNEGGR